MFRTLGTAIVILGSMLAGTRALEAQVQRSESSALLKGSVSSEKETVMEGVLVSAKREGSNMTVTVVTDSRGQYSFPASKLTSGKFHISIRAIGYVLDPP